MRHPHVSSSRLSAACKGRRPRPSSEQHSVVAPQHTRKAGGPQHARRVGRLVRHADCPSTIYESRAELATHGLQPDMLVPPMACLTPRRCDVPSIASPSDAADGLPRHRVADRACTASVGDSRQRLRTQSVHQPALCGRSATSSATVACTAVRWLSGLSGLRGETHATPAISPSL